MNGGVIAIEEAKADHRRRPRAARRRASPRPARRRTVHCAPLSPDPAVARPMPARRPRLRRTQGPWMSASSPTSRGTSRPTSSSSRSSASRPSTARSTSSTGAAGGELRALAAFGELTRQALRHVARGRRRAAGEPAASRSAPATRPSLDRETVVRIGASAERRLGGRAVDSPGDLARPRSPTRRRASRREPSPSSSPAASSRARTTPQTIYRETVETAPPDARRADPRRPGHGRRAPLRGRRRARRDHRRGRQHRPRRSRTAPRTT